MVQREMKGLKSLKVKIWHADSGLNAETEGRWLQPVKRAVEGRDADMATRLRVVIDVPWRRRAEEYQERISEQRGGDILIRRGCKDGRSDHSPSRLSELMD